MGWPFRGRVTLAAEAAVLRAARTVRAVRRMVDSLGRDEVGKGRWGREGPADPERRRGAVARALHYADVPTIATPNIAAPTMP
ncbi:hypothetical protein GCM10017781_25550 [Deinococcus metalli]|uniref:Uncharacterized protein n=1 Tax=Deinococcus metalli TaxID=1141878 RepID=A0ABQ3JNW2_9DEIO|nr:hypothetical protein GCM10017781_25550 [Deinococcus metalli]